MNNSSFLPVSVNLLVINHRINFGVNLHGKLQQMCFYTQVSGLSFLYLLATVLYKFSPDYTN